MGRYQLIIFAVVVGTIFVLGLVLGHWLYSLAPNGILDALSEAWHRFLVAISVNTSSGHSGGSGFTGGTRVVGGDGTTGNAATNPNQGGATFTVNGESSDIPSDLLDFS